MKNTYIIGDLQGCFDELQQLLGKINYRPEEDCLWFVGDLINRGPKSLECLRFVKALEEQGKAKTVLGNHDFHLLAVYSGLVTFLSKSDTIQPILDAPDADELVDWLRKQPLMIHHPQQNAVMVHAGIPPQWSIEEALQFASEAQVPLLGDDWQTFVREELFGSEDTSWDPQMSGWPRIRYIINAFARMRYCDKKGTLNFKLKGSPKKVKKLKQSDPALKGIKPWFKFKKRKSLGTEIFFGHWSTLGEVDKHDVHSTDTGCLWGGSLTAYHLESGQRLCIDCQQQMAPKGSN
ncbi:symmetrical bis(5'-nucleosyl)-tetraphosphatase [Thiomicrorhabdus xiamenensis]|uniref:Bis(5'-nucleosyl)-tetraphosphatase, symmetrical n=1 Tax=Thiomicrorhabdus xiamenensis TaxID=2739063 RepID=A0A7D4NPK1_9GAMM|nr:symmetrical bis(5'-nucleosyl)-tetraphosphatase [Thiomicrorhabdus xiamenensis]QKI89693.1 symmetrical bis(5'-nucleosyl)-tetraphosphatase [Thiomicrorhabdus xiamenensis]